jgi:hypothetical protein
MTPEEQRIAIAEACGYQIEPHGVKAPWDEKLICRGHLSISDMLPDYLNDLNACYEMEWTLSTEQHAAFREKLREIQSLTAGAYEDYERAYVSAPSEDRAEAFLRTLNLWKD